MSDDQLLGKLIQKVDDFEKKNDEWQKAHDNTSIVWRESIDKRFVPLEDFVKNVNFGYKFILGLALLAASLAKAFYWLKDHAK